MGVNSIKKRSLLYGIDALPRIPNADIDVIGVIYTIAGNNWVRSWTETTKPTISRSTENKKCKSTSLRKQLVTLWEFTFQITI